MSQSIKRVAPTYPAEMGGKLTEPVKCAFRVTIAPNGGPTNVRTVADFSDETCSDPFIDATSPALRDWRFVPFVRDGEPVTGEVPVVVIFQWTPDS